MSQLQTEYNILQHYLKGLIEGLQFQLNRDNIDIESKALSVINANREIITILSQIEILHKLQTRIERKIITGAKNDKRTSNKTN